MISNMKTNKIPYLLLAITCILLAVLLMLYSKLSKDAELAKRVESLQIIHRGIMNASDTKGEFINSDVLDINGAIILSWRAEIVPFLFCPAPYPNIKLPWNATDNIRIFATYSQCNGPMSVYCFENKQFSSIYDETSNVFAITGKDTAFDTTLRNNWKFFPEDLLILIELGNSKTFWAAPCDAIDVIFSFKNANLFNSYLGTDGYGVLVTFYDGEIWYLKKSVPLEVLSLLTTISNASKHDRNVVFKDYVIKRWKERHDFSSTGGR